MASGARKRIGFSHGCPVLVGNVFWMRVKPTDQPSGSGSGSGSGESSSHSRNRSTALATRRSQYIYERSDCENVIVGVVQVSIVRDNHEESGYVPSVIDF